MQPRMEFIQSRCIAVDGNCFLWKECPALEQDYKCKKYVEPKDIDRCVTGALTIRGMAYSPKTLLEEIQRDELYYHNGGGVTFSGGEPLMQAKKLLPVLEKLKEKKIHTCFETSLCVPKEKLEVVLPFARQFYVDIKLASEKELKEITGGSFSLYSTNLQLLARTETDVIMRFPIVSGKTDTQDNISNVKRLLNRCGLKKLEIFSVHNLAESKYKSLNMEFHHFNEVPRERLLTIKDELSEDVDDVQIISL